MAKKKKMDIEAYVYAMRDLMSEAKNLPPHIILGNIELIIANLTAEVWKDDEPEKD